MPRHRTVADSTGLHSTLTPWSCRTMAREQKVGKNIVNRLWVCDQKVT
jgi:hypothetical protein